MRIYANLDSFIHTMHVWMNTNLLPCTAHTDRLQLNRARLHLVIFHFIYSAHGKWNGRVYYTYECARVLPCLVLLGPAPRNTTNKMHVYRLCAAGKAHLHRLAGHAQCRHGLAEVRLPA